MTHHANGSDDVTKVWWTPNSNTRGHDGYSFPYSSRLDYSGTTHGLYGLWMIPVTLEVLT